MLGSITPKRWALSVALVGLVSLLFAAALSFSVNRASASVPFDPFLATRCVIPSEVFAPPGANVGVAADFFNGENQIINNAPGLDPNWSGTSFTGSEDNGRIAFLTAPGSGSLTLNFSAEQNNVLVPNCSGNTIVTARAVPPLVQLPPQVFTNPTTPPPTIIDPVGGDSLLITPMTGGTLTFGGTDIIAPPGTFGNDWGGFGLGPLPSPLPSSPGGLFIQGSSGNDVFTFDSSGNRNVNAVLTNAATICLPWTNNDANTAYRGIEGIHIFRLASPGNWVMLNTNINLLTKKACAQFSRNSVFVLGLDPAPAGQATATPSVVLPSAGDYAPGSGSLALLGIAGAGLAGLGFLALRRSRRTTAK